MKVKIEFTINIDTDAWIETYGTPPSEVRDDVKHYAEYIVEEQFRENGLLPKVDYTTPCKDCGINTLPIYGEARAEFYMVTNEIWAAVGAGQGFLCIGCLEARLGRILTPADFIECGLNNLDTADTPRYAWSYRTPRLTARLKGEAK